MSLSRSEPPLDELCSEIAEGQDRFQDERAETNDCESFLDAADGVDQGRRSARLWVLVSLATALCCGLGVWVSQSVQEPVVWVGLEHVPHGSGAWLAAAEAPLPMFFANGSSVELDPKARVRVIDLAKGSAHLTLEMGQTRARLTSDGRESWRFDAGPFTVTSPGTQFLLSWDPEAQLFEITLGRGAVYVEGPILGESKLVESGHSLRVSVPDSLAVLTSLVETPSEPKTGSLP